MRTHAEEPAAPPAAVDFARHDAARWSECLKPLEETVAQAAAQLEAANRNLAQAKMSQAAAEKQLADANAAMTAAAEGKIAAAKAIADAIETLRKSEEKRADEPAVFAAAQTGVETATKSFEAAVAAIPQAAEAAKQAQAAKAEMDRGVAAMEAAVKPAANAKGIADKALAAVTPQEKRARERLAAFEKAAPQAVPSAVRLVQTIKHDRPMMACRFDVHGDYLFAGAQDNSFHRWDLFSGAAEHLKVHKSWVGALAVVSPGGQVLSGGHEGQLTEWNALESTPAPIRSIGAHKGYIRAIAISPDGRLVATAGNDNLVKVWSLADGTLVKELAGHARHVYNVAFHPSGKFLVSGDLMGIIKQWDTAEWKEVRELDAKVLWKYDTGFRADVGGVRGFAFSPDGRQMAAAGFTDVTNAFAGVGGPCVVLYDWESGKQLKVMKPKDAFQGSANAVRFSPAGDFIVAAGGGQGGGLWFFKLDEEKSFHFVKLPSVAYDMDMHPDGLRLAVALFDTTLRVYDMAPAFESTPMPAK